VDGSATLLGAAPPDTGCYADTTLRWLLRSYNAARLKEKVKEGGEWGRGERERLIKIRRNAQILRWPGWVSGSLVARDQYLKIRVTH
jgi:hypothetical protein